MLEIPYTSVEYLNVRYKAGLDLDDAQAQTLIDEASQKLRDEMPAAVSRLEAENKFATLERVTARMVWEALPKDDAPAPPGIETSQFGVGPFQQSVRYTNPSGRLFLTKEDRRALRGGPRASSVSTMPPGAGREYGAAVESL